MRATSGERGGGRKKAPNRPTPARTPTGRGSPEGRGPSMRSNARPNQYGGFDAGKFLGKAVDDFHRGVGAVARGVGDIVSGATRSVPSLPSAINTGASSLMGGQPGVVKKAMTKK